MANEIHTLNVGNTSYPIQPRVLGPMSTHNTNGAQFSASSVVRYDTLLGENPFGPNKSSGYNNAVLSISRYSNDRYTSQLGFSGAGIYARWFNDKTPDATTPWRRFIMDDGGETLNIDTPTLNIENDEINIQTAVADIQTSNGTSVTTDSIVIKSIKAVEDPQFPNTLYGNYTTYDSVFTLNNYTDPEISSILNVQSNGRFYNTGYLLRDLKSPHGNINDNFVLYGDYHVLVPFSRRKIISNYYSTCKDMIDWGARLEDDDYQTFINDEVTPLYIDDALPIILSPYDITTANVGLVLKGCKLAHLDFHKYNYIVTGTVSYYNFDTNIIINEDLRLYDIDVYVTSGIQPTKFFEGVKNADGTSKINIGSQPTKPNGPNAEDSYSPDITIHGRSINLCADSWGNITIGGDLYYSDDSTNGPIVIGRPQVIIDATILRPSNTPHPSGGYSTTDLGGETSRFSGLYVKDADIERAVKVGDKVSATNGFFQTSDERLKNFGDNIKVDFDALSKLRKAYFTWNDNPDTTHIGVSAQEVQELYPEIVTETDGQLSVDYAKLSVVALAAVDELHKKNVELESRLAKLEALLLK